MKRRTPEEIAAKRAECLDLKRNTKMTNKQIAEAIGMSERMVNYYIDGTDLKHKGRREEIEAAIIAADRSKRGWISQTARSLGVVSQYVNDIYHNMIEKGRLDD